MKRIFAAASAGLLLMGCATGENGQVRDDASGTPHYGLNDQPQTSVAGEGSLMPGAYDPRNMQTGQFTGQERTSDFVGQRPTLPREADAREMERSGSIFGGGAGTLGQAGVGSGRNSVNTSLNPGISPSAADIYRSGERNVGSAPSVESSSGSSSSR